MAQTLKFDEQPPSWGLVVCGIVESKTLWFMDQLNDKQDMFSLLQLLSHTILLSPIGWDPSFA